MISKDLLQKVDAIEIESNFSYDIITLTLRDKNMLGMRKKLRLKYERKIAQYDSMGRVIQTDASPLGSQVAWYVLNYLSNNDTV